MPELLFPRGGQTDVERIVGLQEVFFSTTDHKGVITGANQTFANISRFSFPELLGAPHNLIRHHDMPGGVFQIMWDRLLNGQSVATYVKNQAKDGRFYWVFATVTPASSGFLSVRSRPVYQPLWSAADTLYQQTRPLELAASAQGARRFEAAAVGVDAITKGLAGLGFMSFEEFMLAALPAEVSLREQLAVHSVISVDPDSPLGAVVGGSQLVRAHVNALMSQLESLATISETISRTLEGITASQNQLTLLARKAVDVSSGIASLPPSVVNGAVAIEEWAQRAVSALGQIATPLNDVNRHMRQARFDIALNSLHNEMVLSFVNEVLTSTGKDPLASVPLLSHTMMSDVERLALSLDELQHELITVGNRTDEANEALRHVRQFLAAWQLSAARSGADSMLEPIINDIEHQQDQLYEQVTALADLAIAFFTAMRDIDPGALMEPLPVVAYGALSLSQGVA